MEQINQLKKNITSHPLRWSLILAFCIPFILMSCLYIYMGIFPFGNETLYTVDLGQQYIDFYHYFRHTLLNGFDGIFYSFSKSIGGEMLGTWAYYLTSPFLFMLLLFPSQWMSFAVALILLLKLSTAAASMQYLLARKYNDSPLISLPFAIIYAFIGYFSANQLNIMWLDGSIFLPLLIWGIEKFFLKDTFLTYSIMLALILFTNYYIGYMVCLFTCLFFLYRLVVHIATHPKVNWLRKCGQFTLGSLLGGGLSAFLLIPTFLSLRTSKGAYPMPELEWTGAYKIPELLSKFILGAFNFDQMPDGLPNIFVGTLVLICFICFYFNRKFIWQERLAAGILTITLIFSMNIKALNTIWHGFQNPIWYPYRFSFVFSFFLIYIGYRHYRQLTSVALRTAISVLFISVAAIIYLLKNLNTFDYLSAATIWASFSFLVAISALLLLLDQQRTLVLSSLLVLTIAEGFTNSALTVTNLSYLKNTDVTDILAANEATIATYRPEANQFYRLTKTYQRTKNDGLALNYYDLNQFNSTIERGTTELFKNLGFPTSEVFVNYTTGTLVTDALFGIRYYLEPGATVSGTLMQPISNRPDLRQYPIISTTDNITVHENKNVLPLGFMVPKAIQKVDITDTYPIYAQDDVLKAIDTQNLGDTSQVVTQYFTLENFQKLDLRNTVAAEENQINTTYTRKASDSDSYIDLTIHIDTDDAYYLTLPGYLSEDDVTLYLDGKPFPYDDSFRSTQIYNIANNEKGKEKNFTLKLLTNRIRLQDVNLYRLNPNTVDQITQNLQSQSLKLTAFKNGAFSGNVTTKTEDQLLLLTFPYSKGWHFKVDGKTVTSTSLFEDGLTGVPIATTGKHKITAYYLPPGLLLGTSITLLSIGLAIYYHKKKTSR